MALNFTTLLEGYKKKLSGGLNTLSKTPLPQPIQNVVNQPVINRFLNAAPRLINQYGQGYAQTASLGLINPRVPPAKTLPEKAFKGIGMVGGFINPVSLKLGGKVFGGLNTAGSLPTKVALQRLAPNATGLLASRIAPALGGEAAQTAGYIGAKKLSEKLGLSEKTKLTPGSVAQQYLLGLGARGAFNAPSLIRQFAGDKRFSIKYGSKVLQDLTLDEAAGWTKFLDLKKVKYKLEQTADVEGKQIGMGVAGKPTQPKGVGLEPLAQEARKYGISVKDVNVVGSQAGRTATKTSDFDLLITPTKEIKNKFPNYPQFMNDTDYKAFSKIRQSIENDLNTKFGTKNIHVEIGSVKPERPFRPFNDIEMTRWQSGENLRKTVVYGENDIPLPPQPKGVGGEVAMGGIKKPQIKVPQIKTQQVRVREPLTSQQIRVEDQKSLNGIISPNVYNAEPNIQTQTRVANQDLKEWSDMLYKREGAKYKSAEQAITIERGKAVDVLSKNIKQATEKGIKRETLKGQSAARKSYVTTQKGKVITSKGGSPVDREVVAKAQGWKDKPRLSYTRETMERNFEDIMGSDAPVMKERYIAPVKKAEANRVRWKNKERAEIKSLGINPRSKESLLVQQYGEGLISKEQIAKQTNNPQKIINAERVLRSKYDSYLKDINEVLTRNGYDPIPKRKDYFRHFTEIQGTLEQFGIPVRDNTLPTDINGLSADFRPGKNFFSSALQRKGEITDYDAIQGIDTYIEGASKQIFHTDNIQNLRLLDRSIRETFKGTTHLSNFVADLTEYTNVLAGKKAMIDRASEALVGRNIYGATNRLRKQVGANMVGANVSSALTNYIPLTQALATTDKPSFIKGMMQTISSVFKDDGFIDRSDFLTTRLGSDRLSLNLWDKIGNKSGWFFKTIDKFTSGTIVRSKYAEGIKMGLSPVQALKRADEWAGKIMAGRGLGDMPTLFNSQTLGLLTQFQLEVNNQMSFMLKDIPRNFNMIGASSALGQLFLYSYIFNNLFEGATGRRPAFDPIGVAQRTYEDYTNPNMKSGQATKNLVKNIGEQLPFTSTLTGGRIPIGSAIPNPIAVATGESTPKKELSKFFYLAPPAGGGQIKKIIEGTGAFNQGASITDSGRVRYPIPQTPENAVRTGVFGQYSTPEAQQYFREGRTPLGENQSEIFQAGGGEEYYNEILSDRQKSNEIDALKSGSTTGKSGQLGNNFFQLSDGSAVVKLGNDWKTYDTPDEAQNKLNIYNFEQQNGEYDYKSAEYSLNTERLKRDNNYQGWITEAQNYGNYLESYRQQLDPSSKEYLTVTNKIEDLSTQVAKYQSYGGRFKKKAKITIKKVSMRKVTPKTVKKISIPAPRYRKIKGYTITAKTVTKPKIVATKLDKWTPKAETKITKGKQIDLIKI